MEVDYSVNFGMELMKEGKEDGREDKRDVMRKGKMMKNPHSCSVYS